jgi:hypothetical protein
VASSVQFADVASGGPRCGHGAAIIARIVVSSFPVIVLATVLGLTYLARVRLNSLIEVLACVAASIGGITIWLLISHLTGQAFPFSSALYLPSVLITSFILGFACPSYPTQPGKYLVLSQVAVFLIQMAANPASMWFFHFLILLVVLVASAKLSYIGGRLSVRVLDHLQGSK